MACLFITGNQQIKISHNEYNSSQLLGASLYCPYIGIQYNKTLLLLRKLQWGYLLQFGHAKK